MIPKRVEKGYLSVYDCSRCGEEFDSILIDVGEYPVCDKCVKADEWVCAMCHQAVPDTDKGHDVASAFTICTVCKNWCDGQ